MLRKRFVVGTLLFAFLLVSMFLVFNNKSTKNVEAKEVEITEEMEEFFYETDDDIKYIGNFMYRVIEDERIVICYCVKINRVLEDHERFLVDQDG